MTEENENSNQASQEFKKYGNSPEELQSSSMQANTTMVDSNFSQKTNENQKNFDDQSKFIKIGNLQLTQKEKFKMLMQGVSPTSKTDLIQTDMMKAIVHKKQTEDQHIQLRARIMKLQKEAEKANKRLNDLERRQQLVQDMNRLKKEKIEMINQMKEQNKFVEESNRNHFNQSRSERRKKISQNINTHHQRNKSTFLDIKDQQKKIQDLVNQNRMRLLEEKQKAFQNVKELETRAKKIDFKNKTQTFNQIHNDYMSRIKQRYDDAQKTQESSKILEQQETAILTKLQRTFQNEKRLVEELYNTNLQSPFRNQTSANRTSENSGEKFVNVIKRN